MRLFQRLALDKNQLTIFSESVAARSILGREAKGFTKLDLKVIRHYFESLNREIPAEFISQNKKTAHLVYVKIDTLQSLNLGVCASIVMYDRKSKINKS